MRDSYLLGDVDNDGEINVFDATFIQRILGKIVDNFLDENAAQRGTMCEETLSVFDVTQIQRYIAHYSIDYNVGGKMLYD